MGLGNGGGKLHQGNDVIGIMHGYQDAIVVFLGPILLTHFKDLRHFRGRHLLKVDEIDKQPNEKPCNGDVPRPGIKIILVNGQQQIEHNGNNRGQRIPGNAKACFDFGKLAAK